MHRADKNTRAEIPEKLAEAGGLLKGSSDDICQETGVPAADIYGVGSFFHLLSRPHKKVRVCQGLSCRMQGAGEILARAQEAGYPVEGCSCLAACDRPAAVLIERRVHPDVTVTDIVEAGNDWETLRDKSPYAKKEWLGHVGPEQADSGKLAFNLLGQEDYSASAFLKAQKIGVDSLVKELETSGLQGRGGAGFPAARKWQSVLSQKETTRYVVLNADEGEPGTFKDREILVRRPDLVLEGLAIAAEAIGARDVYLYLRGEFEIPIGIMNTAIKKVTDDNLFPNIQFHIHEGQGAYICGEETALIEALEGKRGMPRLKPPFPTEVGLWGKPTLMHNVETIAAIPSIVLKGGRWFHDLGKTGPGSKLYCLSGHVKNPGVYELPLGVSLDELVEAAGGYIGDLYAFSPGGASSGYLPASERTRPLDFQALREVGSGLGSAGVVVMNSSYSINRAVQDQLEFFEAESCGQCAPCRIGTRYQKESMDRFMSACAAKQPQANKELELAEDIGWEMAEGSICGLGHVASVPLTSAMKWFKKEFEV